MSSGILFSLKTVFTMPPNVYRYWPYDHDHRTPGYRVPWEE